MRLPISPQLPKMVSGNMPRDGGHLILSSDEAAQLTKDFETARPLVRRLMETQEFTLGDERWCLWIEDKDLALAFSIPPIKERIQKVREFRSASSAKTTRAYASIPHKFAQRCHKDIDEIIVPKLTTDARGFVTPGFLDGSVIVTDLAFAIFDAQPWVFSILCSSLHAAWVWTVPAGFVLASVIHQTFRTTHFQSLYCQTRKPNCLRSMLGILSALEINILARQLTGFTILT